MTLEELYTQMGGNYDHAKQIMKMDKLIDKYVRKLKNSDVGTNLAAAAEQVMRLMLINIGGKSHV